MFRGDLGNGSLGEGGPAIGEGARNRRTTAGLGERLYAPPPARSGLGVNLYWAGGVGLRVRRCGERVRNTGLRERTRGCAGGGATARILAGGDLDRLMYSLGGGAPGGGA